MKKFTKLAVVAALSLSTSAMFASTYDLADALSTSTESRPMRAYTWLNNQGMLTTGTKAYLNAIPEMAIAVFGNNAANVQTILTNVFAGLTDADKTLAQAELAKAVAIADASSTATTLSSELTAAKNSFGTNAALSVDLLAALGLFPNRTAADLAAFNALVGIAHTDNINARLNTLAAMLAYMANGDTTNAAADMAKLKPLNPGENVLMTTFSSLAQAEAAKLSDDKLKTMTTLFANNLTAALATNSTDTTNNAGTSLNSQLEAFDLGTATAGIKSVLGGEYKDEEIQAFLTKFNPDTGKPIDTSATPSAADEKMMAALAQTQPRQVAKIMTAYFGSDKPIPEVFASVIKNNPVVAASILVDQGFLDVTAAEPSGDSIPAQLLTIIGTMASADAAKVSQAILSKDGLSADFKLPKNLRGSISQAFGF